MRTRPDAAERDYPTGCIRVVDATDTITTLELEGEFDAFLAPEMSEQAGRVLDQGKHLIIDLSETVFIDSSVIHALFKVNAAAQAQGRYVILQLGTATAVERVITITATDSRLLTAESTKTAAIKLIAEHLDHHPRRAMNGRLATPIDLVTPTRQAAETKLRLMHQRLRDTIPLDELAEVIHPQAEMKLLVSLRQPLYGRTAVVEALEQGRLAAMYRGEVRRFEWLDEQTVLTFGRARYGLATRRPRRRTRLLARRVPRRPHLARRSIPTGSRRPPRLPDPIAAQRRHSIVAYDMPAKRISRIVANQPAGGASTESHRRHGRLLTVKEWPLIGCGDMSPRLVWRPAPETDRAGQRWCATSKYFHEGEPPALTSER